MAKHRKELDIAQHLGVATLADVAGPKILELLKAMDGVDQKTRLKAIEQFPSFRVFASRCIEAVQANQKEVIAAAQGGDSKVFSGYQTILDTLSALAQRDDLTLEERQYFVDQMVSLVKDMEAVAQEQKRFLGVVNTDALKAMVALGVISLGILVKVNPLKMIQK